MYYILLLIILYLYIYNPVFTFVGFGFVNILMALSLLYTLFCWYRVKFYLRDYRTEFLLSLVMTLYVTIICTLNGTEQIGFKLVIWIISTVLLPIFLIEIFICRQKNIVFFDTIILVGFIASLISCAALFYPPINTFLRSIQVTKEVTDFAETQMTFRYFGLAINLSSAYGYVQGLLASLCLLRLDKTHKRYAFYFLTMVISVVVNARTGLFPIALTIIYMMLNMILKFNLLGIVKLLLSGLALFSLLTFLLFLNKEIGEFVLDFFIQIGNMLFFEDTGFEDSAYYRMILIPETLQGLIWGEGRSLMGDGSDIGYVNQLFVGGVIFVTMLLMYEYLLYKKIVKRSKEVVYATIFFLSILIFNYKGVDFYISSAFMKLWMLYYFILVHNLRNPNAPIKL